MSVWILKKKWHTHVVKSVTIVTPRVSSPPPDGNKIPVFLPGFSQYFVFIIIDNVCFWAGSIDWYTDQKKSPATVLLID